MSSRIVVLDRIIQPVCIPVEVLRIRRPDVIALARDNAIRGHEPRQRWVIITRIINRQPGDSKSANIPVSSF